MDRGAWVLQSTELQRVRHNWATKQQRQSPTHIPHFSDGKTWVQKTFSGIPTQCCYLEHTGEMTLIGFHLKPHPAQNGQPLAVLCGCPSQVQLTWIPRLSSASLTWGRSGHKQDLHSCKFGTKQQQKSSNHRNQQKAISEKQKDLQVLFWMVPDPSQSPSQALFIDPSQLTCKVTSIISNIVRMRKLKLRKIIRLVRAHTAAGAVFTQWSLGTSPLELNSQGWAAESEPAPSAPDSQQPLFLPPHHTCPARTLTTGLAPHPRSRFSCHCCVHCACLRLGAVGLETKEVKNS